MNAPEQVLRGKRALVVDDDQVNLRVFPLILQTIGGDVSVAKNSQEAIEKCATEAFDIVLIDINLEDGVSTATLVANLKKTISEAKLIVMSGNSTEEMILNPWSYGFDGSITKPFSIQKLSAVIKALDR